MDHQRQHQKFWHLNRDIVKTFRLFLTFISFLICFSNCTYSSNIFFMSSLLFSPPRCPPPPIVFLFLIYILKFFDLKIISSPIVLPFLVFYIYLIELIISAGFYSLPYNLPVQHRLYPRFLTCLCHQFCFGRFFFFFCFLFSLAFRCCSCLRIYLSLWPLPSLCFICLSSLPSSFSSPSFRHTLSPASLSPCRSLCPPSVSVSLFLVFDLSLPFFTIIFVAAVLYLPLGRLSTRPHACTLAPTHTRHIFTVFLTQSLYETSNCLRLFKLLIFSFLFSFFFYTLFFLTLCVSVCVCLHLHIIPSSLIPSLSIPPSPSFFVKKKVTLFKFLS